jgi:hypothetical protein
MAGITHATVRRAARTTEYFIVGQIARKVAPSDRFFLLFEVDPLRRRNHDPRVERARKRHERGGYCIDSCVLAILTRKQMCAVLDAPEWAAEHLAADATLAFNQARCIVLSDDARPPAVVVLSARAVNRPRPPPDETMDDS